MQSLGVKTPIFNSWRSFWCCCRGFFYF